METFFFSPPINFPEKGKLRLAVTSFEATDSVFRQLLKIIVSNLLYHNDGSRRQWKSY